MHRNSYFSNIPLKIAFSQSCCSFFPILLFIFSQLAQMIISFQKIRFCKKLIFSHEIWIRRQQIAVLPQHYCSATVTRSSKIKYINRYQIKRKQQSFCYKLSANFTEIINFINLKLITSSPQLHCDTVDISNKFYKGNLKARESSHTTFVRF